MFLSMSPFSDWIFEIANIEIVEQAVVR